MLEKAIKNNNKSFDYRDMTVQLQQDLGTIQHQIMDAGLPVIILLEGWGASGKGQLIADMIKMLDPRFFSVYSTLPATDAEKRYPLMKRFWEKIPEKGKITVLDRSWYQELAIARLEQDISESEYKKRLAKVNTFERQLTDDGYLIIKFFLHISKGEQKRRFLKLREDDATKWRVTDRDKKRNKNYDSYYKQFDHMLEKTDFPYAHWKVIDTSDRKFTRFQMFNILVSQINNSLNSERRKTPVLQTAEIVSLDKPGFKLASVDLKDKVLTRDKYEQKLKKLQKELSRLHSLIYKHKVPVVVAFEGWDAAGKGGAVKRLASSLDPRGYEAVPIAAPLPPEKNRHYLYRFWQKLPKTGHITIFDRTWYGRVMVEAVEHLTDPHRIDQAYREIVEFESELVDSGVLLIKFWLQIDKETQLLRFNEREQNPLKKWKITDEDWRNREKWDTYEGYIEKMISTTSFSESKWNIIEANDKLYARTKIIKTVADELEKAIRK
ncbi:MAG: polyphosphate:AMP phosphotransferase [Ruminococcus sp.]|jgi:polyphosphate:AMP phosphotransferase|nr:polyphosphate:AMP phosphotransferase [Ruminococcus sp.]